jgi:hypothetical protein
MRSVFKSQNINERGSMMATGRFKWLSAMVAVMVFVMASAAFAQDLPRTAVYVTGDLGENEKKALGTRILVNLFNSGRYSSAERAAHFLAEADKERQTRGAAIDDGHISELGKRFDINVVCVVDVTPVLGEFQISARIVNVETAGIEHLGAAASPLKSLSDLEQVSELVVKNMFSAQVAQAAEAEPAPKITIEPETESMAQASASAPIPADMPHIETSPSPPKGPLKAAVYVTGIPPMVAKPFNSAISSALIKSKIYAGIESINVSGPPSVPALAAAGSNAGVSYIFAINVAGQISVAIIDVAGTMELAKISIDGKITAISAAVIAKKIVDFILTSGPKPDPDALVAEETAPVYNTKNGAYDEPEGKPRILQNRFSIEGSMGGMFGSYRYSYGDTTVNPNRTVHGSGLGGGFNGYLCLDLKYFEWSGGGIAMLLTDRGDVGYFGPNIVGGYLAKYPFVFDQLPVKVTPILGGGNITVNSVVSIGFMFGGRIDVGISEIAYLRSEYLYNLGMDLGGAANKGSSGMSLKAGGGIDIAWGKKKKMFWRTELMYNWLSAYNPEEYKYRVYDEYGHGFSYEHGVDGKSSIHYVDIRTGLGYKWGGKK